MGATRFGRVAANFRFPTAAPRLDAACTSDNDVMWNAARNSGGDQMLRLEITSGFRSDPVIRAYDEQRGERRWTGD